MAEYLMGTHTGTSRKTNEPFYCVDILHVNRFGNWAVDPAYVAKDLWQDVNKRLQCHELCIGDPLNLQTVFGGDLIGVEKNDDLPQLLLE